MKRREDMHIPGNQCGRQMRPPRRPPAAVFMLALACLVGAAQAVEFDEKLKAPMMKDAAELRTHAQAYAMKFSEHRLATPDQLITDAALARQQFDMKWQAKRAIDERKPLEELAPLGLVSRGDGSYSIDMGKHPEWNDFHETIAGMLSRMDLDAWAPALINRGFRPEDVTTLKEYVAAHDASAASRAAVLPVVLGFGKAVRKYDKLKLPVPDSVVLTYFYQRTRSASESDRAWVAGLLKQLDAQRGRILLSIFLEFKPSALWVPSDTKTAIAATLGHARQPNFEELSIAEAKGVAP
jgi:hypothetical protein